MRGGGVMAIKFVTLHLRAHAETCRGDLGRGLSVKTTTTGVICEVNIDILR